MSTDDAASAAPEAAPAWQRLLLPPPLMLLAAFAALWWLLPRLLASACRLAAASPLIAGRPSASELALQEELRANRQERRSLANMERNFVAIAKLDRRANRLRAALREPRHARATRGAVANAAAGLAARALSNFAAVAFLYKAGGWTVMKSRLLADWFAPFHGLMSLGGDGQSVTSASLALLCLGSVSLASGLARCGDSVGDVTGDFGWPPAADAASDADEEGDEELEE